MTSYSRVTDPQQRVDLEDRADILELLTYYALLFDSEDLDGVVDLFTEDAYIEFSFDFGNAGKVVVNGKAELRPFWADNFESARQGGTLVRRHGQPNTVLRRLSDNKVAGTTMAMIGWRATPGSNAWYGAEPHDPTYITGLYEDEFTKIGGLWFFSRRVGTFDQPLPGFSMPDPNN
ncbi:MAG: nuclear transport factor 2 family protein [Nocardioidaceae bacterium]|nr:MAG: nuclear transport factor 2 family protein [Nocardioidaceae bacterium]